VNEKLDVLPRFLIQDIVAGDSNTFVDGAFSRRGAATVGDRGWLFVSETESTIGDIVALSDRAARLDVPNWSDAREGSPENRRAQARFAWR
jgi:hypothetical protein